MSLLQRLTRTLRPSTLHHSLKFHAPGPKTLAPNFYTPSLHRRGLLPRLYNTNTSKYRYHGDTTKINETIIYGLIGANTAIFLYAQYAKMQNDQGFPQPYIKFFQNFTLNYDDVFKEGRWWTAITSVFTHISPMHLIGNMLGTYFFGLMLAQTPGMSPVRLLTLVFGSGLAGSAGYLWFRHNRINRIKADQRPRDLARGMGFSGSVMGIGAVAAILYPKTRVLIYGILPMPLWLLMTSYAVFDGFFLNDPRSRISHAGHIGGLTFGVLYFFARLRLRR